MAQQCCTPEGQIKRYVNCIGCDRKPEEEINEMKQQTAIEWLVKMLYSPVCNGFIQGRRQIPHDIIEQAKAMEKEHIINSYISGDLMEGRANLIDAEQYYNETYNK
jgi:hypothetical protein